MAVTTLEQVSAEVAKLKERVDLQEALIKEAVTRQEPSLALTDFEASAVAEAMSKVLSEVANASSALGSYRLGLDLCSCPVSGELRVKVVRLTDRRGQVEEPVTSGG